MDDDILLEAEGVLLMPIVSGIDSQDDLSVFLSDLSSFTDSALPFSISPDFDFLLSSDNDFLLLDGDVQKIAVVTGDNSVINHAVGDSIIFAAADQIEINGVDGALTVYWEAAPDRDLILNPGAVDITLVLSDQILDASSNLDVRDNVVFIDGYDTGVTLLNDGDTPSKISFVDLKGNQIAVDSGILQHQAATTDAPPPEDLSPVLEPPLADPLAIEEGDNIPLADDWGAEELAMFEDLEALLAQNQAQQRQLQDFDFNAADIFDMQDVAFVSPASSNIPFTGSSSGEDLSFSAQASAAEMGLDEDTALVVEDLDWFLEMGDYTDLVIDDPLFMIEDL
jgi:hypothetical protein